MKSLGYLLIAAAFLAGSMAAVTSVDAVAWGPFLGALAVGVAGVVLARRGTVAEERDPARMERHWTTLEQTLARIETHAVDLAARRTEIPTYDVHSEIDRLFPADLAAFVEARGTIAHKAGLEAYAAVMGEFASGERYLNRSWSASVDGYADEVEASLERAAEQFQAAHQRFRELQPKR